MTNQLIESPIFLKVMPKEKEKILIPNSRQKSPKPVYQRGDRVATPSTTWYKPSHQRCFDFPQLYGTVITATELSAKVLWDIDQEQTTLSTGKLTKIPNSTPLQMEDTNEEIDRSIFKKKKGRLSKKKADLNPVTEVTLSSTDSETEPDKNSCKSPSIRINKKRPRVKSLKEISKKSLFSEDTIPEKAKSSQGPSTSAVTKERQVIVVGKTTMNTRKSVKKPPVEKRIQSTSRRRSKSVPPPKVPSTKEADSSSESEEDSEEDSNEESCDEQSAEDIDEDTTKEKRKLTPEEKKDEKLQKETDFGWKVGERNIDTRLGDTRGYGPKLVNFDTLNTNELDYFLHFFPMKYLREVILPETNQRGRNTISGWVEISVGEFIVWLGIRFVQETVRLPTINDYWNTPQDGAFPAMNMERYMGRARFFNISKALKLAATDVEEAEVLIFIDVLNQVFQSALTPGSDLTVDESMISSRHRNLEGKKKIKRKPRPIGVEIKNLCDSRSMINLVLEKNESKERMAQKDHHAQFGATTACTLRLSKPYHGSGRTLYGDSWFGSVKTCKELLNVGLYSTLVVKTAHVNFPKEMLARQGDLSPGDYKSCVNEVEGLVAVKYMDKKEKLLVSSCATTMQGKPKERISKRTGQKVIMPRPKIFSDYCEKAGSIDIYNHYRTGGVALEDVWKTNSPKLRQFAGLVGFVETNAFLARKYFCQNDNAKKTTHSEFRKRVANLMLMNRMDRNSNVLILRPKLGINADVTVVEHALVKLPKRGKCYMCSNLGVVRIINQTLWCCSLCGTEKPLCSPNTGRQCFMKHIKDGFPSKKYRKSQ